ncbi:MAG: thiamine pyrophosphate-binding protein [Chloroflexota bacterium]|nr:thiamine pyrophosphate-dependent enzyme [Dehalococcoidia bacterium]MEC9447597.1 thiamine pyrophosphate-binding protein [Chloroflexota bacterium]MED5404993.1 thiamine pyrophosphate-binding protein [Chloroflexota bacterium]MEE3246643.1 thiamine pyrophosphate-binding protein [Chloroflexota bacterium]|tara:strand:- start:48 stop:1733 length:1686 start_codon:yes stop_codon:yes gene_type:complete
MRGADAIVRALEQEGVEYIAGFQGGGLNPLWTGLRNSETIKVFAARNERLGVEIADGYARATGKVGVAMTGTGPGATNTLTGIAGAFADNIPVLLLMGQVPLAQLGKEVQQEVSASIFDTLVKWRGTMAKVEDIPSIMRRAFTALRSGSPGPVVLEMPQDVLMTEVPDGSLLYEPVGPGRKAAPAADEVAKAADLLVNAKNPVLNLGGGVLSAEAWDEAKELAELLSMPVATTLVAKGVFPEDHPLSMGMGCYPRSRYASGASLHMNRKADVVLAVGNSYRLPNGTDGRPIPESVSLIHVNADEHDLNKQYQADVPILADAKLALRAILDAVKERIGPGKGGLKEEVVAEIKQAKDKDLGAWEPVFNDTSTPTNGYRVVQELAKIIDPDKTIALHDAGGSRGYMSPFWNATKPRSYLGMGGMAAMGWSLGGAIGAKLGRPDDLVVHLLGDASFGMVGMELETAVRMGLPTLTIVVNNEGTGGGLMGMESPTGPPPDMAKLTGNWSKVAEGLGAYSERVEDPEEVGPALKRAIAATESGQAALVEVMIKPMATPGLPDDWTI